MYRSFLKLRLRMLELGYTSRELARATGIAPSTLSRKMTAHHAFDTLEIMAIARALDIPPEQYGSFFFEDAPAKKGA